MSRASASVNVAVVDDERDLIDVYLRLFRLKKINVSFVAYDGREAVELFSRSACKPDIVIMDNRMPVMNGVDAMGLIKSIDSSVKFIFLSADSGIKDDVTGTGAVFLKKPTSIQDILSAIDAFCSSPDGRNTNGNDNTGRPTRPAAGL